MSRLIVSCLLLSSATKSAGSSLRAGQAASTTFVPPLPALRGRGRCVSGARAMTGAGASDGGSGMRVCAEASGMRYRCFGGEGGDGSAARHALFIHGLGSDSNTCQPLEPALSRATWIVPDLLGHGEGSPKPPSAEAYTMRHQAECVHRVLQAEGVQRLFVIAHSMGGPIALDLLDICRDNGGPEVTGMIYAEGNIDEGDCFGSKKTVDQGPGETAESAAMYHSAGDLVRVSCDGSLWPRLRAAMDGGLPVQFTYGEKNRGRFTSQKLLEDSGVPIGWVPDSGHSMHRDAGMAHFWGIVQERMG